MAEFETAYREQVVPLFEKQGLTESSQRGRATPDSVFTRLFELASLAEFDAQRKAALQDSASVAVWQNLGRTFGTILADDHIKVALTLQTCARSGFINL
jgi:hypothetical protein